MYFTVISSPGKSSFWYILQDNIIPHASRWTKLKIYYYFGIKKQEKLLEFKTLGVSCCFISNKNTIIGWKIMKNIRSKEGVTVINSTKQMKNIGLPHSCSVSGNKPL